MSNKIPPESYATVRQRAHFRCERCGVPNPRPQWHHRRPRAVRGRHQHCACNGVNLCSTCHTWVHAHPTEARDHGFIVSRHTDQPALVPITTPWGIRHHDCTGGFQYTEEQP